MPIAKIRLPDGRVGRFNVPEGTTQEQVLSFAQSNLLQQPQQQPQITTDLPQESSPLTGSQVEEVRREAFIPSPQDVIPDLGRGVVQGGKNLVTGALQAATDVAGRVFPESEFIQEARE